MCTYFLNDMFQAHSARNVVDGIQVYVLDGGGASEARDIRYFFYSTDGFVAFIHVFVV